MPYTFTDITTAMNELLAARGRGDTKMEQDIKDSIQKLWESAPNRGGRKKRSTKRRTTKHYSKMMMF
jgi:hypothetical protein